MNYVLDKIHASIKRLAADEFGEENPEIRRPPQGSDAVYAVPCFRCAREKKENPVQLAAELAEKWSKGLDDTDLIERFEPAKGYVNVFARRNLLLAGILTDMKEAGECYGTLADRRQTVVVDFCSPNIAKPLTVGHLRSTIIGQALINIMKAAGYRVEGVNFLSDWGTQFGKLLYAFKKWGQEDRFASHPIRHLVDLYVKFHKELEKDPGLEDRARSAFKRLEQGAEDERMLWQRFREASLAEFETTVARLGVRFDHNWYESDFEGKARELVERLLGQGIAEHSEGAVIIRTFADEEKPPLVARKSDGTTLYASRDLASALERIERWNPFKLIYVVATEQNLHFLNLGVALDFMLFVDRFNILLGAFDTLRFEIKYSDPPVEYLRSLFIEFERRLKVNPALGNQTKGIYSGFVANCSKERKLWSEVLNIILKDADQPEPSISDAEYGSLDDFESFLLDLVVFYSSDLLENPDRIKTFLRGQLKQTIETRERPPDEKLPVNLRRFRHPTLEDLEIIYHHSLEHVRFGMVSLPEGKISTREGRVVYLDDLLDEAQNRAECIVAEKNPDMGDESRKHTARQVGVGAVIYADLSQDRIKDITFDWKKMLSFDGNSGPYLQYAAVRCARILEKAGVAVDGAIEGADAEKIAEPESAELLLLLGRFPQVIREAAERYSPHILAGYLYDVATGLSRFYTRVQVLRSEADVRPTRLALVQATGSVLRRGLALLGIETPQRM